MASEPRGAAYWAKSLACASTACVIADTVCLPLDFVKVRMQLQNELLPPSAPRLSVLAMTKQIYQSEGIAAFYTGLYVRQFLTAVISLCLLAQSDCSPRPHPIATPLHQACGHAAAGSLWRPLLCELPSGAGRPERWRRSGRCTVQRSNWCWRSLRRSRECARQPDRRLQSPPAS